MIPLGTYLFYETTASAVSERSELYIESAAGEKESTVVVMKIRGRPLTLLIYIICMYIHTSIVLSIPSSAIMKLVHKYITTYNNNKCTYE
jgi:hypothetical protein